MMGQTPRVYIPSFNAIGPPVPEIFLRFLPNLGMAATSSHDLDWTVLDHLYNLTKPYGCSIGSLALIGQGVLEEMMFEHYGQRRRWNMGIP